MQEFVNLCIEQAKTALKRGEVPVGCVIVKDGVVLAKAHNRVEELKDPTAHAEIVAIREATEKLGQKHLYGCEVYVSLEPCPMCAYAMVLARVDRLFFFALDEKVGGVMSRYNLLDEPAFNHRVRWEYIPIEEAGKLLKYFFINRR
ncbi:MAG: nucleoside deaminase [Aquificaceae bacterium]|nr:nucleoside deaminase [Aquificaceae bacterium]MDW8422919.1 nucleoside deaminase [Aquificaceae bacterium]